ncbi:TonB-dependent receptor [Bacteroides sp. GM023]|uniref:SusC/RagA family TonB-linked outer membrane protein n=1 Tax=Bacteroides sp. GM023 TaxID=2723058 RepID=UPI00168AD09E|nr:TonB-dependent receptor [Bacteroides sp. GM023]
MKHSSKIACAMFLALTIPAFSYQVAMAESGTSEAGKVTSVQQQKKRVVTGVITDAVDGTPIVGATVRLKNTTTGVISNLDGVYSVSVVNSRSVLVVSYVGYKTREVPVEDLGVLNIKLHSDNELLDEVVVVGSGTQKKISVTGAISTIKGVELKSPSSSLTNSLAGRLAGVFVNTNSGEPGSASTFYVRGISTFGGRATPLILLDDVEISSGDLNNIPAETIESFTILKDASATAIYGARGANGVMIVTTKSGMENSKTKINVTLENAFHTPTNFPKFVNGATWMEMYNEAQLTRDRSAVARYDDTTIQNTRNHVNPYYYPDVDWGDLIFKDMAMSQRANINVQGGGSKVTYYLSLNVNHDTGLLDSPKIYSWDNNINNLAYNFQNNIQVKLTPTTKVRLNMNAQIRKYKGPNYSTSDLFKKTLTVNPINFPAYYPAEEGDKHVKFGNATLSGNTLYTNPYADMVTSFKEQNMNTLNTSVRIDQDLSFVTKGLSVNGLVNFKSYSTSSYNRSIQPYYYELVNGTYDPSNPSMEVKPLGTSGTEYISQSGISKNGDNTLLLQFQLDYKRRFGNHNVTGMLQYMQREYRSDVLPHRNQGFSGRFTYDYDHRYLAEFNFGYNGSEVLPDGGRFEFFPAVSLGWVISNEKFFKPLTSVIDNMKLRTTFGLVGSDNTHGYPADFLYLDAVKLGEIGFNFGDDWIGSPKGPQVTQYAVINPCWERAKKFDVGLDLTLFRNWNLTFDYYYEKRDRILMQRSAWPKALGYGDAVPWFNQGKMDSWGYELSTSYAYQINKDWRVDLRGTFSYAAHEYVFKDEPSYPYEWKLMTGRISTVTEGYLAEGLFQSEEEIAGHAKQDLGSTPKVGDIKYRDLNGDGVIDKNDYGVISDYSSIPRIQYGFGLNLTWKKFDFGVFFNGAGMRKIMLSGIHPFGQTEYNIFEFIADDYWSEANPNPNAKYPRLAILDGDRANNTVNSTYWLRNGNYLRLKQLELGYSFKYGRVYLTGDNLAVFSPFKEWDPELSWNSYPLQRTFNIGLQLTF